VEPEHYANLILICPSEKGVRREGVEFLAPGETGLSLYGQFLKNVLIHTRSLQSEQKTPAASPRHSERKLNASVRELKAKFGDEPTWRQCRQWAIEKGFPRDLLWKKVTGKDAARKKGRRPKKI